MLEKILEVLKSHAAAKKVCIFFAAFALTIGVMGGSHDIFLGRSDDSVEVQKQTYAAATEFNLANIEAQIAAKSVYAATKKVEVSEVSTDGKESSDDSEKAKPNTKEATTDEKDTVKKMDGKIAEDASTEESLKKSDTTLEKESSVAEKKPAPKKKPKKKAGTSEGFVYSDKIPLSKELQEYTYEKCKERGLEYELILAIMWRESRFTVNAVHFNSNGTRDNGIMQINDINKKWLHERYGITDLMDPFQNIDAGTAMLGELTQKHGAHNALLAYQYGEGGMARKLKQGLTTSDATEVAYDLREYYRSLV